ncbi:helix-turn-helix domain-containing protein [Candidatus Woesearchaeota archaeon]|nr:helix-turn-helix domain-containing protein [Candidatus Woesearchaeota archaeon]
MLTEKEIEVLNLRKKGLKQIEIAKRLKISQPAVSSFENSISRKIRSSIEILELVKKLGLDVSKFKKRGLS